MNRESPTKDIVELLVPVCRGGVHYAKGHQFELLVSTPTQHYCRDEEGRKVLLPRESVWTVVEVPPPPKPKTVADLERMGLVRRMAGGAA